MSCNSVSLTVLVLGAVLACVACEPEAQLNAAAQDPQATKPMLQLKLPPELREVSGLALTPKGTVLAVADEQALVFELDLESAEVVGRTAVGEPPLRGDFEGIEQVHDTIYLVDSDGRLVMYTVGGAQMYKVVKTRAGRRCEIEGLALHAPAQRLYLLCKKSREKPRLKSQVSLLAYSLVDQALEPSADLSLNVAPVLKQLDLKRLAPSALAFTADGSRVTIVAAKQRAAATFDRNGELLSARKLPRAGGHRQAEGLAIMTDGRWLLADEGGQGPGQLSVYAHGF